MDVLILFFWLPAAFFSMGLWLHPIYRKVQQHLATHHEPDKKPKKDLPMK